MIGEPDEIRGTTPGPAADRGLRVNTIGFGSADGGDFDPVCRQRFIGNEPGAFEVSAGFVGLGGLLAALGLLLGRLWRPLP